MRPLYTSTIKVHFSVNIVNVLHSKKAIKLTLKFTLLFRLKKNGMVSKRLFWNTLICLYIIYRYDEGKYSPRKQVLTDCSPAMPLPSLICLKKWCYCFKNMLKAYLWRTSIERLTWTSSRRLLDSTPRVAAIFEQRNKPVTRNDDWFEMMKKLWSWVPSENWNWKQSGKIWQWNLFHISLLYLE